jgi:hypothetical protein
MTCTDRSVVPAPSAVGARHRPVAAVAVPLLVLGVVAVGPTLALLGTDPCVTRAPTGCPATRLPSAAPDVAAAGTSAGPSVRLPMPGPRAGWTVTFADDFTGRDLDRHRWGRYRGRPGGAPPSARWDPGHAVVRDGKLVLRGEKVGGEWLTAGVSMARAGSQTYGRWDVRFRIGRGNGVGYAVLMYPADGGWPPEIDFAEDGGGLRRSSQATLHWGEGNKTVHRSVSADFSVWHTVSVIWSKGSLRYLLDGQVWAGLSGYHVPDQPMWLGLQTQQADCRVEYDNCPLSRTAASVDMEIDWVVRSQPAEGTT